MTPRFARQQRTEASPAGVMNATVYLLPDQFELIKQICADKNRRISDLISEAVGEYLRNHR
jgi:hypothetical protein